jgi:hypothetical protein
MKTCFAHITCVLREGNTRHSSIESVHRPSESFPLDVKPQLVKTSEKVDSKVDYALPLKEIHQRRHTHVFEVKDRNHETTKMHFFRPISVLVS